MNTGIASELILEPPSGPATFLSNADRGDPLAVAAFVVGQLVSTPSGALAAVAPLVSPRLAAELAGTAAAGPPGRVVAAVLTDRSPEWATALVVIDAGAEAEIDPEILRVALAREPDGQWTVTAVHLA